MSFYYLLIALIGLWIQFCYISFTSNDNGVAELLDRILYVFSSLLAFWLCYDTEDKPYQPFSFSLTT